MTHVTYKFATNTQELQQILHLQQKNLPSVLSTKEKIAQGFVTVQHSLEILNEMNRVCPHVIALYKDELVGYALSMDKVFKNSIPILKPMFEVIDKHVDAHFSYIVMGQICVAKNYRGQGVFRGLYRFMANTFKANYNGIITEVDVANTRSMQAHYAIGFKTLHNYVLNNQEWEVLMLPLN
ncbi:hypothetical protein PK35_15855 [Tamlana nanhaiensis]|uniref:N-acetyltransferase domain-containing protein n=1 Tax=Neotamlana nanhaiensis TaxID=1382798 RepID=A0A0D7VX00_9FLAO|nr:GNAT family N-acetyltransferase [Tamlana nanhaiensis]KJD31304.1 hypothetical protein PK35_15855 [Tamlana nanhaiensis]